MNKRFVRIVAMALALLMLCGMALADVRATGDVWMRSGPGRSYSEIKSFKKGHVFKYLGETQMDERPVAWYKVSSGSYTGWISSKYAELVNEDSVVVTQAPTAAPTPVPTAEPTAVPTAEPTPQPDSQAGLPALNAGGLFADSVNGQGAEPAAEPTAEPAAQVSLPDLSQPVELSNYYGMDLVTAANEIGLISYRQVESEAPYQYYDQSVILAGNRNVENIVVYGSGYEIYGVSVGMSASAAMACFNAAGLDYVDSYTGITYEHRAAADAPFSDANGHDSCINLWVNEENIITEIDWSTYTG